MSERLIEDKVEVPHSNVEDHKRGAASPSAGLLKQPEGKKDFPCLPSDGSKVWFHPDGCAWRSKEGAVTVETILGDPVERKGLERYLVAGASLGLLAYERTHAQGAGTGVESPYGIALAPRLVNQELQNHKIEAELREMQKQKRDDVQFKLRTEVTTTPDGKFLKGINYELYGYKKGEGPRIIFTGNIEIEGLTSKPRAILDGDRWNFDNLDHYLKDPRQIK